ncbi:MAG TPA: hypothetical protein VIG88_12945 [Lysobacter sp.]
MADEQLYVPMCTAANVQPDGSCSSVVWVEKPQPVLPPLSLAEGTAVAFGIASVWALGVVFRQYARATRERF